MFQIKKILMLSSSLLFVACVPNGQTSLNPLSLTQKNHTDMEFHTNLENFVSSPFHENIKKEERNSFIKEFIFQSNMQCQHHLRYPSNKRQENQNQNEQDLYMNIFDTVSMVFGVSHITESAKRALMPNTQESSSNQQKYQNALTPEILKGVEIGRKRYANEILNKHTLSIKEYGTNKIKNDMSKYDKQCNHAYGLIEINRALMALQQNMQSPNQTSTTKIDAITVKKKVEAVTKKVIKQKGQKKKPKKEMESVKKESKTPLDS